MKLFGHPTMRAAWITLSLLTEATTANPSRNNKTENVRSCGIQFNDTLESGGAYVAFERPQIQEPLPGFSRIWRGLGLDKRQSACPTTCKSGYGCCDKAKVCCPIGNICYQYGCCADDGSVPCKIGCCPKGTICPTDPSASKCPFATTTLSVLATSYSTSTYVRSFIVSAREVVTISRTDTSVITSTLTSADTATEVKTVTVSSQPARRARALQTPFASPTVISAKALPSAATPVITSTSKSMVPTKLPAQCANTIQRREENPFLPRLLKRQASQSTVMVTTGTTTTVFTVTAFSTSTYRTTTTWETTTTVLSTYTRVLRAGVTVTSTTTTNIWRAESSSPNNPDASSGRTPGSDPSANANSISATGTAAAASATALAVPPRGGNPGLSIGAKAGIGGGIAIAAIIIGVLAFLLWKKRKNNPNGRTVDSQPALEPTPGMGATTYYGNETMTKSMRSSSAMSPAYSAVGAYAPSSPPPQFSPSHSPGPYVYEAPSEGRNTPYVYPVPGENGGARPYIYEAMAPQGREAYMGHGGEHEMYGGQVPQEIGRGTPQVGRVYPHQNQGYGH